MVGSDFCGTVLRPVGKGGPTARIGMICYPSVGGSGIVATELGKHLARRGHAVHFISSDLPFRLAEYQEDVFFHGVEAPQYPLFKEPQYTLALTNRIAQVAREFDLDLLHAHYAIPHATAAYLARQILARAAAGTGRRRLPRVITTLHGTDITLIGNDPSYAETVAFSIDQSDGVTAVSESLRRDTYRELPVRSEIAVIPNFLDCEIHRRMTCRNLRERYARPDEKIVIHVSNMRAVKRPDVVVRVFAAIRRRVPARLLLVGEGPELGATHRLVAELDVAPYVHFLGQQEQVVPLLSIADLFLLPSVKESFGLAALEAMACGVPVLASRVGGLPEVIEDGRGGYLFERDDLDGMVRCGAELLTDPAAHRRVAEAGLRRVHEAFCAELIVPRYEAYYREVLGR